MFKVSPKIINERISALRLEMLSKDIDAYIITSDDNHSSEYVGKYFKAREYFSGFSGSAGTLVVTRDSSALWTDGRYFLQAGYQLDGSEIELMKQGIDGTPSIEAYLEESVPDKGALGFNGFTVSCDFFEKLDKTLSPKHVRIVYDDDLADIIWDNRPRMSAEPIWELDIPGQISRNAKIQIIREKLIEKDLDFILISSLDQIAWTLNLRGNDIHCCPVFLSYMVISINDANLFINPSIISDDIKDCLKDDGINIRPYNDITDFLITYCNGKCVWADKKSTSYSLMRALDSAEKIDSSESPVLLLKAVKSEAEQNGMRNAHLRDGVALTKFIFWLKSNVGKIDITELSATEKLLTLRQQQEQFFDISFDTITGYGPHGAIIHYQSSEESDVPMKEESFCLVDSGGQYYDGTTDVTRTISLGNLTSEQRKNYTLVLQCHLALGHTRFKSGTTGFTLDKLAREPLQKHGLDYLHGTGHGVGCVLNVHEGPQRISTISSDYPILPGMITSNEPGLYLENEYGIRIENLTLCKSYSITDGEETLCFETLTLVPYDRNAIDVSILSEDEIIKINDYHEKVFLSLSPYLSEDEKLWLRNETAPLS